MWSFAGTDHKFFRVHESFEHELHVAFRHAGFLCQSLDRGKRLAPVIRVVSNGQEQEQVSTLML